MPRGSGQRVRAHPCVLGARSRDAVPAGASGELRGDPAARVVAARPRAGRGIGAGVGTGRWAWRRSSPELPRWSTITPRPSAIDGSLDVIADAFESLGLRSVLCYEVTDRDGPERAAAGVEESRRFLAREPRPLVRGMVGAHASFTLSEETLAACVELARSADTGIHVHVAEDAADERDALARFGTRVVQRLADAGALDRRSSLAHCVHLDSSERELVRDAGAAVAHNPRSNMNNRVGRTPLADLGERVALGTDGIGVRHVRGVASWVLPVREDDAGRAARLAPGAPGCGAPSSPASCSASRRSGPSRRERRRTWSSSTTTAPDAARPATTCRGTGCSGCPRGWFGTWWWAARWWSATGGSRKVDRGGARREGGGGREAAVGRDGRSSARIRFEPEGGRGDGRAERGPGRACTCRTSTRIRDGMRYAQQAEEHGVRGRVAGGEPAGARGHGADGRVRRRHRADQGRLRRGQQLDQERRPARRDVLDARRPGAGPRDPRHRRVVGPARAEGRHRAAQRRFSRCGRPSRPCGGCSRWSGVTFHGEFVDVDDIEIDIVHGDRSPKDVPIYIGATGMKMMELAGEIADGVVLNYLVGPAYNATALEALAAGAERAGRTRRGHRPPAARGLLARRGPRPRARPRPRAGHAVPRAAAAHHEGERRRPVLLDDIGKVLTWPAGPEEIRRAMKLVPDEVVQMITASGTRGRVPDEGARVR